MEGQSAQHKAKHHSEDVVFNHSVISLEVWLMV